MLTSVRHLRLPSRRLMIIYVAQRLARVCIEDAMNYANKRKVFGKKLIESEVIRSKVGGSALTSIPTEC